MDSEFGTKIDEIFEATYFEKNRLVWNICDLEHRLWKGCDIFFHKNECGLGQKFKNAEDERFEIYFGESIYLIFVIRENTSLIKFAIDSLNSDW